MKNNIQLPTALLPGQGYTLKVDTVGWAPAGGQGGFTGRGGGWVPAGGQGGFTGRGGSDRSCFNCGQVGHISR